MQPAVNYRIDPNVEREIGTSCRRLLDDRIDCLCRNLRSDIGFAKKPCIRTIVRPVAYAIPVQPADRRESRPNGIIGFAIHCRLHTAASVMAHNYCVPDQQNLRGKFQRGRETGIVRNRQIGDVAMKRTSRRMEIENFGCRNPPVGTPYPGISRSSLADETA